MLAVAVWVLSLAVVAGTILALWHLRGPDEGLGPPLAAGLAHGAAGAVGLVILLFALRGPPRGVEAGAGSFGTTAAVLFGGAILTGVVVLLVRKKGTVIAIHAGIAITGYVLLLAWDALG